MYVNSLLNGQEEHTAAIDPESGTATLRFEQYGTVMAYVSCGPVFGMCWIAPGETLDMYIAMEAGGRAVVQRRDKECEPAPGRRLYTTGAYADLNALVDASGGSSIRMNLYSGDFADYRMSADEYTQMVVSKYESLADSIARSPVSGMMKELSLLTLQQEALGAMSNGPGLLKHNYRSRHEDWDYGKKADYEFAVFAPEHYAVLAGLFDLNNPKLLMGMSSSDYCYSIIAPHIGWANIAHATEGILADLPKVYQLPSKAENNALTQEDLDLLHSLKEPFYAEACEAMQARVRKELESVKDVRIETTPEVAVDKLFDAIVAPYKGKVVFVDFWNTWCGPCRASIKANEPLKSGELKSDDLVWIYIANETSPLVAYKTSIAKIAGKHYRLDDAQWKYLCEKFRIDGIPSYVLVDRDGSYELRNDFRDHDLMKRRSRGCSNDLREPVGRRDQFSCHESAPLPGKPEFRIDASGSTKMQKAVRRTGLLYFRVAARFHRLRHRAASASAGWNPALCRTRCEARLSGSVSAVMCRTPGCCFAQAHNARTVSVM